MANQFQYVTRAQALAALQGRLYLGSDATQQFWTSSELVALLLEAMQTWNALAAFWKGELSFQLQNNTTWYDLTAVANTIRPFTTTDNQITTLIESHLLEPLTNSYPLLWTGSGQFSLSDILGAIERAQNELLGLSSCTLTRSVVPLLPGRTILADSTLIVRRVAWVPDDAVNFSVSPLEQTDAFALDSFDATWTTAAQEPPSSWLQSSEPPLGIDLDRTSPTPASLEIISANSGPSPALNASSVLPIPDDWAWVLKFGAMADLFAKESLAKDPLREKYCRQRFQQGLMLLGVAPAVLNARMNGKPVGVDSVRNGDDFNPLWQAATPGLPTQIYTMGLNLIAASPTPDSSTAYAATFSVVRNQVLPAADGDFLQIPRDAYDSILGYAQHLAMLKVGGAEFLATVPLWQALLKCAAMYNSKVSAMGYFAKQMRELSQLQNQRDPIYSTAGR